MNSQLTNPMHKMKSGPAYEIFAEPTEFFAKSYCYHNAAINFRNVTLLHAMIFNVSRVVFTRTPSSLCRFF